MLLYYWHFIHVENTICQWMLSSSFLHETNWRKVVTFSSQSLGSLWPTVVLEHTESLLISLHECSSCLITNVLHFWAPTSRTERTVTVTGALPLSSDCALVATSPLLTQTLSYRIYSCISQPFTTKKSAQKIAVDFYTIHTQRPDQAVREINITAAWSASGKPNGGRFSSVFGVLCSSRKYPDPYHGGNFK